MEEPLKIAVCEDSGADRDTLLSILRQSSIPSVPTVFESGEALLQAYAPMEFDLLLTDIYMDGISGVEAVTRIREIDPDIPIAFVTSSPDHTLESYRLSVLKYIEKPYTAGDIQAMLQLARMSRDSAPALTVLHCGKPLRIRYSRILYLEQQTHRLRIVQEGGQELSICEKLSDLLPQLEDNSFFCSHKSYAVNLAHVRSLDQELRCFLMADGSNVPIRRESLAKARKALESHLFRQLRDR